MPVLHPWARNVYVAAVAVLSVAVAMRMPQTSLAWGALGAGVAAVCWPFARHRRWWWIPTLLVCFGLGFFVWSRFISSPRTNELFGSIGFVVFGIVGNATVLVLWWTARHRGRNELPH
jgi:hypothetical protein